MYTYVLHCGHVQLFDMSETKALVTSISNGTNCVHGNLFLQNGNVSV